MYELSKKGVSMRKISLFCLLIYFAIFIIGCIHAPPKKHITRKNQAIRKARENIAIFKVSGLDENAKAKITANMRRFDAVESVQIDESKGIVKVRLKKNKTVSASSLRQAIKQAGYTPQQTLQSPLELEQLEKKM